MSTFIAGFDGATCRNCGLSVDAHLRYVGAGETAEQVMCLEMMRTPPDQACAVPPDSTDLAHELLALVERERWWLTPAVFGIAHCRACGSMEGAEHHPACRYGVLSEQIGRLS